MTEKLRIDWFLFIIIVALALFGAVMVYSASAMISLRETGNSTELQYAGKQLLFTVIGLVVMYVVSQIDYHIYENKMIVFAALIVTVVLLAAVFGFGPINGARRWIRLAGMTFQPSEVAKFTLPLFLAWFLTLRQKAVAEMATVGWLVAVMGAICGLVVLEPDLGTTMVLCAIFVTVYISAGAKWLHIGSVLLVMLCGLVGLLLIAPWRVARLLAFLDPCSLENKEGAGYQVCQSLLGVGSGGLLGEGFAKGSQKLFYLPYPYSDFIFATIGEELGLVGALLIVAVFAIILWRGAVAALTAPDRFGRLLGIGITTGLVVQALFNISVVISLVPAKGIPLPLVSYGGSSVIVTLATLGVLLNISKYSGTVAVSVTSEAAPPRRRPRRQA